MKSREDWLAEVEQRQRNIDPMGRIPNVASFQGTLIKGDRTLTPFQRIAALAFGTSSLMTGAFLIAQFLNLAKQKPSFISLVEPFFFALFSCLGIWFGFQIVRNAWVNKGVPRKRDLLRRTKR